ncbi:MULTISPECIES: RseA family anti-sigma factor [Thalassotalea]|uniref:Anti-sigma-E factor RseA n=1 Tax=Thalassotalea castellviae TaxID=3075612 RepID=A0ABU3A0P0_9GAMM|nr:RseA family anti-sigma factor [Thalassotalea sp. W431]MDT0603524.1 RseA family anti-sigma factor [Thalassotalea sp. W431]
MSESKFETVSSLVDNYQTNDDVFDELVKDNHMSETWQRYHMIGDAMRDELPHSLNTDLSTSIANAIAEEPTVLAPIAKPSFTESVKAKVVQFSKPFGQVAIAASAAGLMVIGVQQNVAETDPLVPNPIVQTVPFGGIAEPVSLNYQQNDRASKQQAMVEQQRRFQALLQDHKQQLKFTALAEKAENAEKEVTNPVK